MNHTWILGSGGLLGSAMQQLLLQEQDRTMFFPSFAFSWTDSAVLRRQFAEVVKAFAKTIGDDDTWELHWMAGQSTMSSETAELKKETDALSYFLTEFAAAPAIARAEGTIVFASSAGGIYAGSRDETITEVSAPHPLTPYGEEKLIQEELIHVFAQKLPLVSAFIARLSTLYGPKQSQAKKQGLLTHIARCILRRKTVEIFVPLDTIRDYLHVRDAANVIRCCLQRLCGSRAVTIKIIASEEPTTVAQIIRLFTHAVRVRPRIVRSSSPKSDFYVRRLVFRSIVLTDARPARRTSLLCGIADILGFERLAASKASQYSA